MYIRLKKTKCTNIVRCNIMRFGGHRPIYYCELNWLKWFKCLCIQVTTLPNPCTSHLASRMVCDQVTLLKWKFKTVITVRQWLFDYLSEFKAHSVEKSAPGQCRAERRRFEPKSARDFLSLQSTSNCINSDLLSCLLAHMKCVTETSRKQGQNDNDVARGLWRVYIMCGTFTVF